MTNAALKELIASWFPNAKADMDHQNSDGDSDSNDNKESPIENPLEFTEEGSEFLNIQVPEALLHELMLKLKTHPETHFDYLFCLTGMDWEPALGVVYHLESTEHRHIVVVKVKTEDRDHPSFDSVSDIWKTAEFHEREVYDFFGIRFNNHPNLKRLFLTDEWDGYPLRKDYVDEINMVIK
ncbi:NADH-quinone oxidoreductase subunit C [Aestuariivivens sediminicola]|uniref:NADH-quinone oxidoreductase subunit C n=1 Tax=Aestuariivivens sediminicola TaxID=2913560 RepID=UPI001F592D0A|nr:NADH-quinone oxidoreductase subunit C [Aestuariivivens sediminicola]